MILSVHACLCSVQSTAKSKPPMPADKADSVSHTSLIELHQQVPTVASMPHSDTCIKAATRLPSVGLSANAAGSAQNTQANATPGQFRNGGATGLSLEICGISLSPSRQAELAKQNCDRVMNSTPVKDVKHCLDFDESDSAVRSPKLKKVCVHEESDVYKPPAVENGHTSPIKADSNKSCLHKNVVFHASMPVSVPQSHTDVDKFAALTPVTQRSHKFLVCFFF